MKNPTWNLRSPTLLAVALATGCGSSDAQGSIEDSGAGAHDSALVDSAADTADVSETMADTAGESDVDSTSEAGVDADAPNETDAPDEADVPNEADASDDADGDAPALEVGSWKKMSGSPLSRRASSWVVWTGKELIVWGGTGSLPAAQSDGARYDPVTDRWTMMAPAPAGFAGRAQGYDQGRGVWTGSKMIIWGGRDEARAASYNDGAIYDPSTDSWTMMSASPLSARIANAVYAPSVDGVLIWGDARGYGFTAKNDGAIYRPSSDDWVAMPSLTTPRSLPAYQWTGTELMIWGGAGPSGQLSDGITYDPVSGAITGLPSAPAGFEPRSYFGRATVSGGLMVIGGEDLSTSPLPSLTDGLYFDATGSVARIPAIPTSIHSSRLFFPQSWCDGVDRCWFWSGGAGSAGGAMVSLTTRTWSPMATLDAPKDRCFAAVAWTGTSAIVWGGEDPTAGYLNDGAIFTP